MRDPVRCPRCEREPQLVEFHTFSYLYCKTCKVEVTPREPKSKLKVTFRPEDVKKPGVCGTVPGAWNLAGT